MKKIKALIEGYCFAISEIEKSAQNNPEELTKYIALTRDCLNELREYIRENDFSNDNDEIYFFKSLKPKVYGKLKFFAFKQKFLSYRSIGSVQSQRAYIKKDLRKLEANKKKHLDFFKYYNENNCFLDDKYFLRGNFQMDIFSDTSHLNKDPFFSTSHDIKAAEIIAYKLIFKYYQKELELLKDKKVKVEVKEVKSEIFKDFNWTASKTDLVEMLFGLNELGAINNGNVEMKRIVEVFEIIFGVDLGNVYKTFGQIKAREKDPAKFLDLLKTNLIRKINSEN